jgi:hypothetical protein
MDVMHLLPLCLLTTMFVTGAMVGHVQLQLMTPPH